MYPTLKIILKFYFYQTLIIGLEITNKWIWFWLKPPWEHFRVNPICNVIMNRIELKNGSNRKQVTRPCAAGWLRSLGKCCWWYFDIIECWINLGEEGFSPVHHRAIVGCWQTLPGTYQYQGLKMIIHQSPGAEIREPGMKSNKRSQHRVSVIIAILDPGFIWSSQGCICFLLIIHTFNDVLSINNNLFAPRSTPFLISRDLAGISLIIVRLTRE